MEEESHRPHRVRHFISRRLLFLAICLLPACEDGGSGNTSGGGPVASPGCEYAELGETTSGRLQGRDSEERSLSYSIVQPPTKGMLTLTNPLTGDFAYTPNYNSTGVDTFTFRVSNGQDSSAPVTYRIVYTPRILPLGDSITEGVGAGTSPPPAERVSYRKRLYEDLTAAGYRVDFVGSLSNGSAAGLADADHEGHPGWCDDNTPFCNVGGGQTVDDNIVDILDTHRPNTILLHIGTNHFNTSADGVNSALNKISGWAQANHPVNVFLARIIPTVDGSLDVTTFNNNVQAIAGDRPGVTVRVVDQQSQLRNGSDANRANASYMADNLHPNTTGYERMAARWYADITASGALPSCN